MWYRKAFKHGHSVGVVIPVEVAEHFEIKRGDFLAIGVNSENQIVIEKAPEAFSQSFSEQIITA